MALRAYLLITWPGFADAQIPPIELLAVESLDRRVGTVARHLDETEASRSAGDLIRDQSDAFDLPMSGEEFSYFVFSSGEGQVAHIDLLHLVSLSILGVRFADAKHAAIVEVIPYTGNILREQASLLADLKGNYFRKDLGMPRTAAHSPSGVALFSRWSDCRGNKYLCPVDSNTQRPGR